MGSPSLPDMVERVDLRPIRDGFAFVTLRLPDVNLGGIEARRDSAGRVTLSPPMREDAQGRRWPMFALQPGAAELAARAVAVVWARTEGRR